VKNKDHIQELQPLSIFRHIYMIEILWNIKDLMVATWYLYG